MRSDFSLNNNNNNEITSGQQYNIGGKPTVMLYTYINHHVGTSKLHGLKVIHYYNVLVLVR